LRQGFSQDGIVNDDPEAFGRYQLHHGMNYGHMVDLTFEIAVGMPITGHPPHRTGRAAFPHPAPTLDV
jgi:hypothetical protein